MEIRPQLLSLLLLLLALPRPASGQAASAADDQDRGMVIVGTVVDRTTGEPLHNAAITVLPADGDGAVVWGGESNPDGVFRTDRLGMGTYDIRVRMLGFSDVDHRATFSEDGVVDLRVEMVATPFQLAPVVVTAVRQSRLETGGFFDRRRRGMGHTMTRAEIEARGASRVSDLFHTIPGARVISARPGRSAGVLLRGNCVPILVLDGVAISNPVPIDDILTMDQLEALEVYNGVSTGPIRYGGSNCGTIMAWSREPGAEQGFPFSWRRLFVGVGLFVLFAWLSAG